MAGLIGIVGIGAAAYFGVQFVSATSEGRPPAGEDPVDTVRTVVAPRPTPRTTPTTTSPPPTTTPPPVREPVIASTESAVRERARERFLTSTQNLLRDLPPIPAQWPGGAYISFPSDNPEVADVWQSYLATIRSVRAGDERRYATAYEAALDDAAVDGEVRVTRLNAALANFSSGAALRSAHYDRVEALATAAIQSHNALVEAEGLFIFDATGTSGGRGSLGRGVSGRDADSQLLLDQVLSLLSGALEAGGLGPREGSNVRSWVWDGLLGAVAN